MKDSDIHLKNHKDLKIKDPIIKLKIKAQN